MIIIFAYKNMVVLGTMPIVFLKVLFYNQDKIVKEDNQMRVGFIGLGIMGKPMAKNLLKAGYDLVVDGLGHKA